MTTEPSPEQGATEPPASNDVPPTQPVQQQPGPGLPDDAPPAYAGRLRLRYTAVSDVGRVRKDNQDSGYAGPHFLVVADGVGGSARGDVASSAAVEELRALDVPPGNDLLGAVADGIDAAHQRIAGLVEQHPELDGTSTTVTAVIFDGTRLGVGHVGDSRGYLMRGGQLAQLTKDHTFVQSLIDEGRITEAESRVHPHRNLILRAVDGVHETEPDLFTVDVRAGDRIMLCSDGASGVLDDTELARILLDGTVENAAVDLVRDALDAGSSDNVTVVVADVVDTGDEDPDETQALLVGPIVVGAAGERRRPTGRRRSRRTDTGDLEAVPAEAEAEGAVATDVDPETLRYAPRAPRRFVWLRRLAVLVVVGVLVWLGSSAAYAWSQRQYYVAPSGDKVAIFKGVEADVPVLTLHRVYEVSDTTVDDLPSYNRGQVRAGMTTKNLAAARALVIRLGRAAVCQQQATQPPTTLTPTATPTATPTKKPTARATGKAGAKAGATATKTPSATPSATVLPSPSASPSGGTGATGSSADCTDGE